MMSSRWWYITPAKWNLMCSLFPTYRGNLDRGILRSLKKASNESGCPVPSLYLILLIPCESKDRNLLAICLVHHHCCRLGALSAAFPRNTQLSPTDTANLAQNHSMNQKCHLLDRVLCLLHWLCLRHHLRDAHCSLTHADHCRSHLGSVSR